MKKYKILVLTDHGVHSAENSIYGIIPEMLAHPQCSSLDIASRAHVENKLFFDGEVQHELMVSEAKADFTFDSTGKSYSGLKKTYVKDYDLLFMRLPRPIPDEFLIGLSSAFKDKVIVNHPDGIMKTSNKKFLLNFPELCPSMQMCKSLEDIISFSERFDIVLKPLKDYGGKGILKMSGGIINDGMNNYEALPYLKERQEYIREEGYLGMKYLKNVVKGDKRLLVVDGEILASSLRIPALGSWLCNVSRGGRSEIARPETEEIEIVSKINPVLNSLGVLIYGIDTLVEDNGKRVLSEINTLSIGGFVQSQTQTGQPIIQTLLNKIFNHADNCYVD
jgi:glutathione synthase